MSKRAAKGGGRADGEKKAAPEALYVYCIGERHAVAPLFEETLPAPIESSSSLEAVTAGDLAAVASAVALADYGEEALQARLTDAAWTATRALRHERAVEFFARRVSVIPLRFGTIYLERDSIAALLVERRAEFRAIIERLRGCEEWGVNLYTDRARLQETIARVSPRLCEMVSRASSLSPGQAYLLRKKIDALRADEMRAETRRVAAEIEGALASASDAPGVRLRLLKDEATEHGELAAKLAFLINRERFARFRATAERLAESHAPTGFRLELTGPWPAYNFASELKQQAPGAESKD